MIATTNQPEIRHTWVYKMTTADGVLELRAIDTIGKMYPEG